MKKVLVFTVLSVFLSLMPFRSLADGGLDLGRLDHQAHVGWGMGLTLAGSMLVRRLVPELSVYQAALVGGTFALLPLALLQGPPIYGARINRGAFAADIIGVGLGASIYIVLD